MKMKEFGQRGAAVPGIPGSATVMSIIIMQGFCQGYDSNMLNKTLVIVLTTKSMFTTDNLPNNQVAELVC